MYLFLPASSKQIAPCNSGAKANRDHGGRGRRVGRPACPPLAESVSSETVVSPALRGGGCFSCPFAFPRRREVAVFPKYRLWQAAGLLGALSQADSLFFLQEKHRFSVSPLFIFLLGTRENSLKFFPSSGLICSLSLGCREVITVVYYLVKDP